ncbi:hypothetical protein TgHK011_007855 [Trichoderma gracile]|nr:hypothetical protein TgHK011_007855 [Trichoderma gracile]
MGCQGAAQDLAREERSRPSRAAVDGSVSDAREQLLVGLAFGRGYASQREVVVRASMLSGFGPMSFVLSSSFLSDSFLAWAAGLDVATPSRPASSSRLDDAPKQSSGLKFCEAQAEPLDLCKGLEEIPPKESVASTWMLGYLLPPRCDCLPTSHIRYM